MEKHSNTVSNQQKNKIWLEISEKINALGVAHRTVKEIRDKWRNTTSKAKAKFTEFRYEMKKTGGGPAPSKPSAHLEKVINMFQDSASFKGIDGGLETGCKQDSMVPVATAFDGENIERVPEGNARIPIPLSPIIVFTYNNSPTCDSRPIDDAENITVNPLSACPTTIDMVYTATPVLFATTHAAPSKTPSVTKAQVNAEAEGNTKKRKKITQDEVFSMQYEVLREQYQLTQEKKRALKIKMEHEERKKVKTELQKLSVDITSHSSLSELASILSLD
ncbi:unnamed protein product [Mytilus coruscus]|uniref:Myb/SANT-like DNA-binding domain-containing protein n=1 Tax=Mytilus coruscus TaxID=42192 RepID=A0A6J8CRP3_MYTCO|nr:unnamed protein product [Mytilus coruscus]